jgi:hypothetical protein
MFKFVYDERLSYIMFQIAMDLFDKLLTKMQGWNEEDAKFAGWSCLLMALKNGSTYFSLHGGIATRIYRKCVNTSILEVNDDAHLRAQGSTDYIENEGGILKTVDYYTLDGQLCIDFLSYYFLYSGYDSRRRCLSLMIMTHSSLSLCMTQYPYSIIALSSLVLAGQLLETQPWVSITNLLFFISLDK